MTLPTAANQDKCDYCDKGDIELTKYDVSPITIQILLNFIIYALTANKNLVDRK